MEIKNKIFNAETLTTLKKIPDKIFDCGVTSPPYNKKEKNNGWLTKNVIYDNYKDVMPEKKYQQNQIDVLNELYRVTKDGGHFFYNHKCRWEKGEMFHPMSWLSLTKWKIRQEIIWNRGIASNIRGWRFWQVEERIYWLYKPIDKKIQGDEMQSKHALMTSIWNIRPEIGNNHPAPFPLTIPLRCIYSVLDDGKEKNIIDPYAGSGTTLVAAKMLGHNYTGIEISNNYIEYAKERLNDLEQFKNTFEEEIVKHKVNKTFKERKAEGKWKSKKNKKII